MVKIKCKILFILLVVGFNTSLYSQIDTTLIYTISKLQLLTDVAAWNRNKYDKNFVNKVISAPIPVRFLRSSGFAHFLFTFIPINELDIKADSIIFFTNCKGYILAVDTLKVESYKIYGFYENDMLKLLMHLKRGAYPHLGNARVFSKYYSIEGVDLYCLYRATKRNNRDTKKYPCLKYCGEPIYVY
jgi:hypothetical protein